MTSPESLGAEAVRRLTMSSDPWLSCDECFDRLDVVVEEALTAGEPMPAAFGAHLRACAVCREEAYSLVTLVAADHGLHADQGAAALDASLSTVAQDDRSSNLD